MGVGARTTAVAWWSCLAIGRRLAVASSALAGWLCSCNALTLVMLSGLARRVKLLLLFLSFLYPSLWNLLNFTYYLQK